MTARYPLVLNGTAIQEVQPGDTLNNAAGAALLYSGGALGTPASGTLTSCTGLPYNTGITAAPHTVQVFTSGSGTYTKPTNCVAIKVRMVGGGGGGNGGNAGGVGGTGGSTTFGTTYLTCNGGQGSITGGAASGGNINLAGGAGNYAVVDSAANGPGGSGGNSPFGGGGGGLPYGNAGTAGAANTGGGGGGGGCTAGGPGAGGGAGGYLEMLISSPSATYAYAVGAGGTAGTAPANGYVGGAGGSGIIIVEEYYL
jgi:hypothetical protein